MSVSANTTIDEPTLKIVITGASGFVGSELIPYFERGNTELLLVGRNIKKLERMYPGAKISDYEHFAELADGYDVLLHLAIMNNDQMGDLKLFRAANVKLLKRVAKAARNAKIKYFINTTTFHVIDKNNFTAYAQTKAEGEVFLSEFKGVQVTNLRLPSVYGTGFSGKLGMLNGTPTILRPLLLNILGALKPTVHAKLVANVVLNTKVGSFKPELIVSNRQERNWVYTGFKRFVDIGFALTVILLFWWILILVWTVVKISSSGPAIFAQDRVGKNRKKFTCYKFRTMQAGTKQMATHHATESSITGVGKILRRTKLDELPQVWNILKNEISLVGPRPCLPMQSELIDARNARGVFASKCGITGLAQIKGVDMSDPKRLAILDEQYLAMRTIPLDIKIILATALGRGIGDNIDTG